MKLFQHIIEQAEFQQEDLVCLLNSKGEEQQALFDKAGRVKDETVGDKVYLRGLVEFSNICSKNCLYCGIRKSNTNVIRYDMADSDILNACRLAWENRLGSVVLQSGELSSPAFVRRVNNLLKEIKKLSNGELGITLSCGEQNLETYRRWFDSGAHRYLLRIESSTPELYRKIHPDNELHSFTKRLECLFLLRKSGYQVGTGVMIGLPFQTLNDLAADLLFLKQMDIDMIGMGPYIEHEATPLYAYRNLLKPKSERLNLALKMIAALRLLMPDVNIAASTALQAIDPIGREKAVQIGANVVMPNITPCNYREDYLLYEGKPCEGEETDLKEQFADRKIGYGEWGDSKHFYKRKKFY